MTYIAKHSPSAANATVDLEAGFAPRKRMAWPAAILAILGFSMLLWGTLLMSLGALIG